MKVILILCSNLTDILPLSCAPRKYFLLKPHGMVAVLSSEEPAEFKE